MRLLLVALAITAAAAGQQQRSERPPESGTSAGVTAAQIERPSTDSWPTYNGDYSGRRFSALAKIDASNVKHLSLAWIYDMPIAALRGLTATPVQVGGVLYFSGSGQAYAVEARTGRELWHYGFPNPRRGGGGSRGVAVLGDSVYFTPECNLVALDIKTGAQKWAKEFCSMEMMYYSTAAPVVIKDKVIVGVSGDDLDQPAFLDARRSDNGELIWRWYVTPQKEGDPGLDTWPNLDMARHGGGMTWQPVTYDPELNLIFVTTGNPQPVVAFKNREGANLFTASIVALNADTGKMVWYFQASPNDTHDWDATQTAVVFDGPSMDSLGSSSRRLRATDNSSCWIARTARPSSRASSSKTNWKLGYDDKGQPIPESREAAAGRRCAGHPGSVRRDELVSRRSFNPRTGLFYVNANRAFSVWYIYDASDNPMGWGGTDRGGYAEQPQLKAIDYQTGRIRWSTPRYGANCGLLSTAGNLLFGPAASGIGAYDATTGEPLWTSRIGNVTNGPITYELDGFQYVVAGAGTRLVAFVLND